MPFTCCLQAETLEDLQEWKTALDNALALAPSATNNAGQNGILKSDQADEANCAADQRMLLFCYMQRVCSSFAFT